MKMYLPPPGQPHSRRAVLRKGLLGGALLTLGGMGYLATRRGAPVTVPEGLAVLDEREFAVVTALTLHFVPKRAGFPDPLAQGTPRAVDAIIARLDDSARRELKQLLMLFENALPAFLFGFRTRPFTRLAVDEQARVLEEWRDSAITLRRAGYLALRTLVTGAYYQDRAVWASVGYPGPPPGLHQPDAPVWKGGGQPRPPGNGVWIEPSAPGGEEVR